MKSRQNRYIVSALKDQKYLHIFFVNFGDITKLDNHFQNQNNTIAVALTGL
jgi:hypothetical protein